MRLKFIGVHFLSAHLSEVYGCPCSVLVLIFRLTSMRVLILVFARAKIVGVLFIVRQGEVRGCPFHRPFHRIFGI